MEIKSCPACGVPWAPYQIAKPRKGRCRRPLMSPWPVQVCACTETQVAEAAHVAAADARQVAGNTGSDAEWRAARAALHVARVELDAVRAAKPEGK